jgi:hypothetical protein
MKIKESIVWQGVLLFLIVIHANKRVGLAVRTETVGDTFEENYKSQLTINDNLDSAQKEAMEADKQFDTWVRHVIKIEPVDCEELIARAQAKGGKLFEKEETIDPLLRYGVRLFLAKSCAENICRYLLERSVEPDPFTEYEEEMLAKIDIEIESWKEMVRDIIPEEIAKGIFSEASEIAEALLETL